MRYHRGMDRDDDAPRPPPAHWLEAIAESDADSAAGRIVPAAVVHAELRASLARLEAKLAGLLEPEAKPSSVPQER